MAEQQTDVNIKHNESHVVVDGILFKKCSIHHLYFETDETDLFPCTTDYFYKNNRGGLSPYCKKCAIAKSYKYNQDNADKYKKWKSKANAKRKPQKRLSEASRRSDGKILEWQRNNKEKIKGYAKQRTANKTHTVSKQEWNDCKLYFENKCAYCGLPHEKHYVSYAGNVKIGDFHKEHVDDKGVNDLSNCVPSCKSCNTSKWCFTFDEWYNEKNPNFTQERYDRIIKWLNDDYKQYIKQQQTI